MLATQRALAPSARLTATRVTLATKRTLTRPALAGQPLVSLRHACLQL
jgi:hypothetical protein